MKTHQEFHTEPNTRQAGPAGRTGNASSPSRSAAAGWALVIGIIVIAANLRAPLTSVGSLIGTIRDSLHLSGAWAGAITTLPLLAFALLSPFASRLARRFGMETVILVSLGALAAGIVIRSAAGAGALFAGTMLLGLSIAICNVLMPALVKRDFPAKVGIMTGVYSVSMNLCGAIASGISVPLAHGLGLGWRGALGCWAILALAAALLWAPQARRRPKPAGQAQPSAAGASRTSLRRSALAWHVTLFMGLQSLVFYVSVAWLPEMLSERGMGTAAAGWMLSLLQFAVLPFTFIVPIIAAKMKNQRPLVVLTFLLYVTSIAGLLFGGNALIPLWMILFGIATGFAFSLAMMFFTLRTRSAHEAAELSGMAQSAGYLLAAIGPTLFGLLHDATQSWTLPLMLLIAASLLILVFGWFAGKDRYLNDSR